MLRAFCALFLRDCRIYIGRPTESFAAVGFFSLVISFFLILFAWETRLLVQIGPALIWVAVLLSVLMSIETLLRSDYQAAVLDHLILSPHPLAILCLAKMLAHVCVMGMPLLVLAPCISVLFHFNPAAMLALTLGLALGIPVISFIASVGAALTLGLDRGAWLMSLLILPLLLPPILLGVHMVLSANQGLSWYADGLLLGALCIMSVVLMPMLMAYSLRVSLE